MKKKVALFDVDKTLVAGYSGYFTARRLIQSGIVKKRHIAKAIFYKAISPLYKADVRRMYEIILSETAGHSLETILEIGRQCFEFDIQPRLYQEGLELIQSHQQKGHPLYFVTAGPYMTIKVLGDYLGVSAEFAPGPVIRDGVLQKEMREPIAHRRGKVEIANIVMEREGVSLADCYYYGDDIDDLDLLQEVGHPHAVNPDRKLEKVARQNNWPILRFERLVGENHRA